MTRTKEVYRSLHEKAKPRDLSEGVKKEMDKIVEAADWYCKK